MIHIQGQVTSGWGLVSAEVATNGGRWIFRKTCFRRMNKQWFIGVNSVVLNLRTPAVVVPRVLAPFIETGGRRHQRSPVVWSRSPLQSRRQTALPLSLFLVYVRGTTILIIHANIRALWFCSYTPFCISAVCPTGTEPDLGTPHCSAGSSRPDVYCTHCFSYSLNWAVR